MSNSNRRKVGPNLRPFQSETGTKKDADTLDMENFTTPGRGYSATFQHVGDVDRDERFNDGRNTPQGETEGSG